jgi:hypothetical protein
MTIRFVRAAFICAVSVAAICSAQAKGPSLTAAVVKPLKDAQDLVGKQDYQGALAKVKEAEAVPGLTAFDTYTINRFLGVVEINLKDYNAAAAAYEAAIDSGAVPDTDKKEMLHNAVLLSTQVNHCQKAAAYAQQLVALEPLTSDMNSNLAICAYNAKDMATANKYAQAAIDQAKAAGQPPPEAMMQITMNGQVQSKDQAGAMATLEQMASTYGTPQQWGQLIDIALSQRGTSNIDGLYLYRLRIVAGAMNADDYSPMAQLAGRQLGYPGEALAVLQQGVAKGAPVSGELPQARTSVAQDQKSLPGFAAQAAKNTTGEYDEKLAETYYGYGRYAEAEQAARDAIRKGGMKDPSSGQMILGQALAAEGKYADAAQAFNMVTTGSPGRTRAAHLWMLYAQFKAKASTTGAQPASSPAR